MKEEEASSSKFGDAEFEDLTESSEPIVKIQKPLNVFINCIIPIILWCILKILDVPWYCKVEKLVK